MVKKSYQSKVENLFQRYRELEFQRFQAKRTAGEGGGHRKDDLANKKSASQCPSPGVPQPGKGKQRQQL